MIVVRTVFQAEWGKASELAHMMHQELERAGQRAGAGHWRILTDLSGPFNTVVMEVEVASLAAWEQGRAAMFADPQWQQGMAQTAGMIVSGAQEYYTLEAQG
jgi:hypothetical protein